MRSIFLRSGLLATALLFSACAQESEHSKTTTVINEPPAPNKPVSTEGLYGTWEGEGAAEDGSTSHTMTFEFKPGQLVLTKKCIYSGDTFNGIVTIEARASTKEEDRGLHLTMTSPLLARSQSPGGPCEIDLPPGLDFFLRDGKVVLQLGDRVQVTSLKRVTK